MQLVEILSHSNKIKTVDDLLNHFDLVVELARDDIYKIAKSKRLLFSDFDFDYEIKDLEDDKLKQNLQKLKVMLEEYKEPYPFDFKENWDDSIILNDSRWLEIVNFAKNIINDINENPLE